MNERERVGETERVGAEGAEEYGVSLGAKVNPVIAARTSALVRYLSRLIQ